MHKYRSMTAGFALVGALGLAACSSSAKSTIATTASAVAADSKASGTIDAADQNSDGKTITVKSVSIKGSSGFIAVHSDVAGAPGPVVGHVAIPEGASSNVVVTFDSPQKSGAYWPMLHIDAGKIGTYEFPGVDLPVTSGTDIVMKKVTLTVG